MDDIHDFEDGYDMPRAFHATVTSTVQSRGSGMEARRQRNDRHNRRMTPMPRSDGPMQMHSQEKRGLTAALSHAQTEARILQRQMEDMKRELRGAREVLSREQTKREEDRHLLDARGEELRNSQAFLTKADAYSHADIKAIVDALNSEIMQLASYMSDTLRLEQSQFNLSDGDTSDAVSWAKPVLGDRMVCLLGRRDDQDFLEVALLCSLQAVMVHTCNLMIRRWHREREKYTTSARSCTRMSKPAIGYQCLCTFLDAPDVAGRCNALTRAESKYRSKEGVEDLCSRLLVAHLWSVLRIAGWLASDGRSTIEKGLGAGYWRYPS